MIKDKKESQEKSIRSFVLRL